MFRWIFTRLATAAAVAAALSAPPSLAVDIDYPHLFGTSETRSDNLKPFTKWTGVLERMYADRGRDTAPCTPANSPKCRMQDWQAYLATLAGKPKREQIDAVNLYMNRHAYIEDMPN